MGKSRLPGDATPAAFLVACWEDPGTQSGGVQASARIFPVAALSLTAVKYSVSTDLYRPIENHLSPVALPKVCQVDSSPPNGADGRPRHGNSTTTTTTALTMTARGSSRCSDRSTVTTTATAGTTSGATSMPPPPLSSAACGSGAVPALQPDHPPSPSTHPPPIADPTPSARRRPPFIAPYFAPLCSPSCAPAAPGRTLASPLGPRRPIPRRPSIKHATRLTASLSMSCRGARATWRPSLSAHHTMVLSRTEHDLNYASDTLGSLSMSCRTPACHVLIMSLSLWTSTEVQVHHKSSYLRYFGLTMMSGPDGARVSCVHILCTTARTSAGERCQRIRADVLLFLLLLLL